VLFVSVGGVVWIVDGEDGGDERIGEAEVEACNEELDFRAGPGGTCMLM